MDRIPLHPTQLPQTNNLPPPQKPPNKEQRRNNHPSKDKNTSSNQNKTPGNKDKHPISKPIVPPPPPPNPLALEIKQHVRLSTPTQSMLLERKRVIDRLYRIINHSNALARPPGAAAYRLEVFGSIRFGLDSIDSDLDICIIDPDRPNGLRENEVNPRRLPPVYDMHKLGRALRYSRDFTDIVPISTARTPIVKLRSYPSRIAIDLNYLNFFKSLALIIKLWAKSRGYCDPSGRSGPISASSYTLILLLIAYLQYIKHLPNLQDPDYLSDLNDPYLIHVLSSKKLPRNKTNQKGIKQSKNRNKPVVVGIDTSFVTSPPPRFNWTPNVHVREDNQRAFDETLTAMLIGFFQFYHEFSFGEHLISIRDGYPLKREPLDAEEEEDEEGQLMESLDAPINNAPPVADDQLDDLRESLMRYPRSTSGIPVLDFNDLGETELPQRHPTLLRWSHPMVVVDPFVYDRNTAGNIKMDTFRKFHAEFSRALRILLHGGSLSDLCSYFIP